MSTVVAGANRDLMMGALKDVEELYNCKVLHWAVMGSRRWGFQSPDSDFDIHFVYVYPSERYVTQEGIPHESLKFKRGLFEFQGWELVSWLKFVRKSNVYPTEHLFAEWNGVGAENLTPLRGMIMMDHYNYYPQWMHHASVVRKEIYAANESPNGMPTLKSALYMARSLATMIRLRMQYEENVSRGVIANMPELDFEQLMYNNGRNDVFPDVVQVHLKRLMIARNKGLAADEQINPEIWKQLKMIYVNESNELPKPERNYFGHPVRLNAFTVETLRKHGPTYDYRNIEGGLALLNQRTEALGYEI